MLKRLRSGKVYDGPVVRSSDPLLVRWPGPYAMRADGRPDRGRPLVWDRDEKVWRYAAKHPAGFGVTDTHADDLLDHDLGGSTWTPPATWTVHLFTVAPSDSTGGTEVSTGVWTNYSSVAVTNNLTNFPAASGRAKSNGTAIDFGTASITGTAPEVVAVGLKDGSAVLRHWALLTTPKTINDGDPVDFPVGDLDFSVAASA